VTQPPDPNLQTEPPEGPQAPSTGEEPQSAAPSPDGADAGQQSAGDAAAALESRLAERTADLQRLQAEYVNYKRRVDRDRGLVRDTATAAVLTALLPVLDDVDRARDHGELTGGFKAVAESLERTVAGLGLIRFGEAGEPFDPRVHEALMHELSDDVDGPTARAILQPGYRIGERVVRPARVAVAEPATTAAAVTLDESEAPLGAGPVDDDIAGPDVADDADAVPDAGEAAAAAGAGDGVGDVAADAADPAAGADATGDGVDSRDSSNRT
jgi:molecular chaperone GrpE